MEREITGTEDPELGASMIRSATEATQAVAQIPNESIVSLYEELQPRNILESMLIGEMTAAHSHCLELFKKAGDNTVFEIQASRLKLADKLMRTFASCLETLEKTRRGGNQTVKVEHLHIQEGAQAVVGNVGREDFNYGGKQP